MKTLGCDTEDTSTTVSPVPDSQEVTDLLINTKRGHDLIACNDDLLKTYNVLKTITPMGHKGHYQRVLLKNNVTQDSRSQSLPDCSDDKRPVALKLDLQVESTCDTPKNNANEPGSPSESWFRTWPERKGSDNNSSPENETNPPDQNTQQQQQQQQTNNCDIVENGNFKYKLSLSEALQNISLAYSPVTKQLHLVEKPVTSLEESEESKQAVDEVDKAVGNSKTHKRTEAGSFSSTISSLSDLSPLGSLLESDQRSVSSDDYQARPKRKSLTNFFNRNVFSWKASYPVSTASSSVWKLFSKTPRENSNSSPHHVVASSTALIQHPRPSNLPAKSQAEEQRHRDEYNAMIAAAKRKEAQNTVARQKLQKLQLQQEEHHATATKHFTKHVLPNWEAMSTSKKTRDLWWQGLPSSVRGKVWRLAIGNELNVTPQLYEICLSRAQNRLNSPEPSHCESDIDQESSMDVIQLDISRTFPHLCIFQEGGPYSDMLHALLAAYVCYRPDVGYVQGMSFIAAILILNMEAYDAFTCFANLLNQPLHLSAFTLNQEQMNAYYSAYNEVFGYNLPRLHLHFESSKLTPDLYLLDWIYTTFAKAMPLDVACRVWDVFLRDGYEFIFRTALGILHLNQDVLLDMDFLHGAQFLTRLPDDLSSDLLFKSIQTVTTSIGKQTFSQIVDKYSSSFQ